MAPQSYDKRGENTRYAYMDTHTWQVPWLSVIKSMIIIITTS
ncbi:hypothetical protein COLO4_07374 [Corchorus olitorius]|uniref:Uncharacterized protein n=1 Tax=Corchorus olitorius TaxID=93759 RepID=A0A1R3KJY3_9ROSI|nr:hypothetical protein COLO4_07374 [Corchorus olitorius]